MRVRVSERELLCSGSFPCQSFITHHTRARLLYFFLVHFFLYSLYHHTFGSFAWFGCTDCLSRSVLFFFQVLLYEYSKRVRVPTDVYTRSGVVQPYRRTLASSYYFVLSFLLGQQQCSSLFPGQTIHFHGRALYPTTHTFLEVS